MAVARSLAHACVAAALFAGGTIQYADAHTGILRRTVIVAKGCPIVWRGPSLRQAMADARARAEADAAGVLYRRSAYRGGYW
jgi:hypothetical protein